MCSDCGPRMPPNLGAKNINNQVVKTVNDAVIFTVVRDRMGHAKNPRPAGDARAICDFLFQVRA